MILKPLSPNIYANQELDVSGTLQSGRKFKKDLRLFSSLGGLQARINFLYTSLLKDVIPKGFQLKWKEQTGLNCDALSAKVSAIIVCTSKSLLKEVLDISKKKFSQVVINIEEKKTKTPDEIWQKGIHNYNFCYNQTSQRLTKKLQKISNVDSMEVCLPHKSFSSSSSSFSTSSDNTPIHDPQYTEHAGAHGGEEGGDDGAPGGQDGGCDNFPLSSNKIPKKVFFTPDQTHPL